MPASTFHNLIEACQQAGCPVCMVEQSMLDRYIGNLFYESVNDIKIRDRLRASFGFCREHARMVIDKRLGNALGFAVIYQDIITKILRGLENDADVTNALTPREACIACGHQDKTTQLILSALVKGLREPGLSDSLRSSDGLCIPHLKKAFETIRDSETFNLLLLIHRKKLENLRNELTEFIRKNDYRFRDEGFGAEGNSWKRAVEKLTGNRVRPWE